MIVEGRYLPHTYLHLFIARGCIHVRFTRQVVQLNGEAAEYAVPSKFSFLFGARKMLVSTMCYSGAPGNVHLLSLSKRAQAPELRKDSEVVLAAVRQSGAVLEARSRKGWKGGGMTRLSWNT